MNLRRTREALTHARDHYADARELYQTARHAYAPRTEYRQLLTAAMDARRSLRAAAAAHREAILART